MKIIVLGAGNIGSDLVRELFHERHEVTVVDALAQRVEDLRHDLDIRTVVGHPSHPEVLRAAGAQDADLLIAATGSDEINILACEIASILFKVPRKISRLHSSGYLNEEELLSGDRRLHIDVVISPEKLVTEYIHGLIEYPGALEVLNFAHGRVRLLGIVIGPDSPLLGLALKDLPQHAKDFSARVVSIYRGGEALIPTGSTDIRVHDHVSFVVDSKQAHTAMRAFHRSEKPLTQVMIAGGGHIGEGLAQRLEKRHNIKIIEASNDKVRDLTFKMDSRTLVLRGSATDARLLREENLAQMDVFCVLTNNDEVNMVSALLAKRLGANKVLALVNRPDYRKIMEENHIDVPISPREITLGAVLRSIRRGDVVAVHSLFGGKAEALEAVAHGGPENSPLVGRTLKELKLPPRTEVGALVRGSEVIIANGNPRIEDKDHLIFFINDKRQLSKLEKLFQVGINYI